MSKLLTDKQVDAAIAKKLAGSGQPHIERLREDVARVNPHSPLRLPAVSAGELVAEVDALRDALARAAIEVRAARRNVKLDLESAPYPFQCCMNCLSFDAVKTTEAHAPVERQSIVQEAGVCRHNPPISRGPAGGTPNASSFPPVWPGQWCRRWEINNNKKVPPQ